MKFFTLIYCLLSVTSLSIAAQDTVFTTHSGKWIIKSQNVDFPMYGIYFQDKLLKEYDAVSIDTVISFSDHEILVFGFGSPNGNYSALNFVWANSVDARIISEDIDVTRQKTSIKVDKGAINVYLGYKNKKARAATIIKDRVSIKEIVHKPVGSLPEDDCKESYDALLELCNASDLNISECNTPSPQSYNSYFYNLNDNPYFNKNAFLATCRLACKKNTKPIYRSYAAEVCQVTDKTNADTKTVASLPAPTLGEALAGLMSATSKPINAKQKSTLKDGTSCECDSLSNSYYESGALKVEKPFTNGKRNGLGRQYYESGALKTQSKFRNDSVEGNVNVYYESGRLESETLYHNGKKQGVEKGYFESGALKYENSFYDDRQVGDSRTYYETGTLKTITPYINNLQNGPKIEYDESGALRSPSSGSAASVELGSFIDSRDRHEYRQTTIGSQTWMAENLAFLPEKINTQSKLSNADAYYYVQGYDGTDMGAAKATGYYHKYGVLYNYPAALTSCPDGWRLPTDEDWQSLVDTVGGGRYGAMNRGAVNYGFSVLLGGYFASGIFSSIGMNAIWWSSTPKDSSSADAWLIYSDNVLLRALSRHNGASVRCIKAKSSSGSSTGQSSATSPVIGSFTDVRDGRSYKWSKIGSQNWMSENMAYLPKVNHFEDTSTTIAKYYVHSFRGTDAASAKVTENYNNYGALYNYKAALTACPDGWHIPRKEEWQTLMDYAGGNKIAGTRLKANSKLWDSNTGTDIYGFSALPGANHLATINYGGGNEGTWWSSTENGSLFAYYVLMYSNSSIVDLQSKNASDDAGYEPTPGLSVLVMRPRPASGKSGKRYGLSVRCVMN